MLIVQNLSRTTQDLARRCCRFLAAFLHTGDTDTTAERADRKRKRNSHYQSIGWFRCIKSLPKRRVELSAEMICCRQVRCFDRAEEMQFPRAISADHSRRVLVHRV